MDKKYIISDIKYLFCSFMLEQVCFREIYLEIVLIKSNKLAFKFLEDSKRENSNHSHLSGEVALILIKLIWFDYDILNSIWLKRRDNSSQSCALISVQSEKHQLFCITMFSSTQTKQDLKFVLPQACILENDVILWYIVLL